MQYASEFHELQRAADGSRHSLAFYLQESYGVALTKKPLGGEFQRHCRGRFDRVYSCAPSTFLSRALCSVQAKVSCLCGRAELSSS